MTMQTVGSRALKSAGWTAGAGWLSTAVSFAGNVALARLLVPADFGTLAVSLTILTFIFVPGSLSFNLAIIQCRDEAVADVEDTAFGLSLLLGGALAVAGLAVAWLLEPIYGPEVRQIVSILSLFRSANLLAYCYSATLERKLDYRPVAVTSILSLVGSYAVGIGLALAGLGVWALVGREMAVTAVSLVGLRISSGYRWRLHFNLDTMRWIWTFGWRMMLARVGEILFGSFDNFAIGTLNSRAALGYYSQAYTLAMVGHRFTQTVIQSVTFSTYAAVQNNPRLLKQGYEAVNFWLFRASVLLFVGTAAWGSSVVVLVYGDRWRNAGLLFQAMAFFLAALPLHENAKSLLIASGHVESVMRIRLVQVACFLPLVWWQAAANGPFGVVWVVNGCLALSLGLMLWKIHHLLRVDWQRLAGWPVVAGAVSALGALVLEMALGSLAPILRLGIEVVVAIVLYVGLLLVLERKTLFSEIDQVWSRLAERK